MYIIDFSFPSEFVPNDEQLQCGISALNDLVKNKIDVVACWLVRFTQNYNLNKVLRLEINGTELDTVKRVAHELRHTLTSDKASVRIWHSAALPVSL